MKGRKAIVIFTDGVDWRSDSTKYDDNIRQLEESSVIVYPIRYDTRYETEALARQQQERGETVDLGVIFGGPGDRIPPGTTPPTLPGGQGTPTPSGRGGQPDTMRLPIPPVIIGGGRYPDRYPGGGRYPDDRYPPDRYPQGRNPDGGRYPDDRYPPDRYPDDRYPDSRNPSRRRSNDSISVMLDNLYRTADQYLQDMATRSGGELHRADTLGSLPDAFANIAAELRNQYSLGYYPANQARDGKYRKIQVKISRKSKQHWYTRRYSTGSGSDRVPPSKRLLCKAPGRYRSRYCTNVAWFDLDGGRFQKPSTAEIHPVLKVERVQ